MTSFISGCLSLCGQVTQSGRRYRWQISFWRPLQWNSCAYLHTLYISSKNSHRPTFSH